LEKSFFKVILSEIAFVVKRGVSDFIVIGGCSMVDNIRVVLADDHPLMRMGIKNMLNRAPDITVVGEAEDGYKALDLAYSLQPDVLLLDMEMPGLKGVEVAQELEASGSTIPILVLSGYEDKQFILGVLAAGAAGYLTKEEVPETIIKAVRGVARGEQGWVSARIAKRIKEWLKDSLVT
jgi:DNA-binding NarL/FixJ family response regulator